MVKSAQDRITRSQIKFDPYVNQLRAKAMLYKNNNMFARRSKMQEILDALLKDLDLGYALSAKGRDLAWKLYSGHTVTLLDWLAAGLPESAYNLLVAKIAEIKSQYEFYVFPPSMLCSTIEVTGLNFEQMYDDADGIVNKIAVDPFMHKVIMSQSPLFPLKIGAHSSRVIAPLNLDQPQTKFESSEIRLMFDNVLDEFLASGVGISFPISATNLNAYTLSPTFNISVVKTP